MAGQLLRRYHCPECRTSASTLDSDRIPACGTCRGAMRWQQTRIYHAENHGWSTGMKAPAIDFNQTREMIAPIGPGGVRVESLRDIRRIERESEKMAADGVPGAERVIFRKYSQDPGNLHTHTMGAAPDAAPSKEFLRKQGGVQANLNHADQDPDTVAVELGPGTDPTQVSYLPDEPTHG